MEKDTCSPTEVGTEPKKDFINDEANVDEALQILKKYGEQRLVLDDATSKRLLRRIDFIIMPVMCIAYGLNYLDKTSLSYASIMGLKTDISLQGDNYQWLGSVFYFGYLAWEFPAGRLMQRYPLAKYNGINIILWGLTLACFASVSNFSGAVAVRFMLGVFEASVTLGFTLITSQWYTKAEQAVRMSIWVSSNGFAQILGGVISYGIARGDASSDKGLSLAPWKVLFLLTGLLTIVVGVAFLVLVPDSQMNAWWLSPRDRALAVERVRINQQGIGNRKFKLYQFREALVDPQTWAMFLLATAFCITNGGLTNFFSQLIVSFGFTPLQSLLYGTPVGVIEIVALIGWGIISQRFGNRLLWSIGGVLLSLLGAIMIFALPDHLRVGRLVGYYFTQAFVTGFIAVLSLISSNVAGYTKKTTVGVIYLVGYCIGNIVGPQTFRPSESPQFYSAKITVVVMYAFCTLDIIFIYWYYRRLNIKKREARVRSGYTKIENQEWLDLTDWENTEFMYSL